jgi:hypothetical protein
MRLSTSLVCGVLITMPVGCGEKGDGNPDGESGGTASQAGSSTAGTTATSAGSSSGSSSGGTSSGGSAASAMPVYTFDADTQAFKIQDSSAATDVEPVPKADIMLSFNSEDGSPDPGSLQLDIPYSAASQYVSAGVNIDPPGVDLTGKTIKAMVKIVSGYGSEEDIMTAPANAKLYVKTGANYVYASAAVANITSIGSWTAISFNTKLPDYNADKDAYDPAEVLEIGIQMDTNSASMSATDAVVLIDSISY